MAAEVECASAPARIGRLLYHDVVYHPHGNNWSHGCWNVWQFLWMFRYTFPCTAVFFDIIHSPWQPAYPRCLALDTSTQCRYFYPWSKPWLSRRFQYRDDVLGSLPFSAPRLLLWTSRLSLSGDPWIMPLVILCGLHSRICNPHGIVTVGLPQQLPDLELSCPVT